MVVIVIILVGALFIYIRHRNKEKKREEERRDELRKLRDKADKFYHLYPAIYYKKFNKLYSCLSESELDSLKSEREEDWECQQNEHDTNRELEFLKEWESKQKNFNSDCIEAEDLLMADWGRYTYNVAKARKLPNGKNHRTRLTVWNMFAHSCCRDLTLDYSLGFNQAKTSKLSYQYLAGKKVLDNSYWDLIYDYITKLFEHSKDIIVIIADTEKAETSSGTTYDPYVYIKNRLNDSFTYISINDIYESNAFKECKQIVVVELISNKGRMVDNCQKIIQERLYPQPKAKSDVQKIIESSVRDIRQHHPGRSKYPSHSTPDWADKLSNAPVINYISIFKELSSSEMQELIDKKRKEIEDEIKAAQEKQKKELEELKRAQEQFRKEQARIQKENEEKEKKRTATTRLRNAISSWYRPTSANLKCFSMYYYYPTTCDFEASQYDWDIRNMIWNFKANPHKPIPIDTVMQLHRNAVSKIVEDMKKCLHHFFGDDLKYLTLVCVPSSKAVINQRRYEDFSQTICKQTNMENGYTHVRVTADGEAKHMGGTNVAKYEIDADFFKDKNIILFDDVITSGKSMEQLRARLQNAGANVIGGFSIGKTKHDKQLSHPINELDNPHTAYSSPLDDLPF